MCTTLKDVSGMSSFRRLETRRSTGKIDLSELENAISCDRKVQVKFEADFFLPLYVIHAAQVYKCERQI